MSAEVYNAVDRVAICDEIAQEKINLQTNEKLEESIKILECQLATIEDEENEWKTRYLLQKEVNDYYKRAYFICDQLIPRAKTIQRVVNRTTRKGSKISRYLDLEEEPLKELEAYKKYMIKLCQELNSRIEQEGKAYYWATEIRKRALIELNYTYIPAPIGKHFMERRDDDDQEGARKPNHRILNSKYGLSQKLSGVRKLPPMHF